MSTWDAYTTPVESMPATLCGYSEDGTLLGGANYVEHLLYIGEAIAAERHVADEHFVVDGHQVRVSTVFLVQPAGVTESGELLLWETMTFIDGESCGAVRTTNRQDAAEQHAVVVQAVKDGALPVD